MYHNICVVIYMCVIYICIINTYYMHIYVYFSLNTYMYDMYYRYKCVYVRVYIINVLRIYIKLATVVEGNQKAPFSIATTGVREDATRFPGLLHFTLDTYLILLSRYQVPFLKSSV